MQNCNINILAGYVSLRLSSLIWRCTSHLIHYVGICAVRGEWHMCPAPYGWCWNWDLNCVGTTDSACSLSCQFPEMNIRFSIFAWALTVNVLADLPFPFCCYALLLSAAEKTHTCTHKINYASCPQSLDNLASFSLVQSPINISEWFARNVALAVLVTSVKML